MDLTKLLRPLANRLSNMLARGVVKLIDDSAKMQILQVLVGPDEPREGIERIQNYGFTSVPLEGAEAFLAFIGGRRDHGVAICVDDRRYRLTSLESGEVALYDHTGSSIVFKASGDIEIVPSSGNVTLTGTLTASVDVVGGGKSLKNHTHSAGTLMDSAGTAVGPVTGSTGAPS